MNWHRRVKNLHSVKVLGLKIARCDAGNAATRDIKNSSIMTCHRNPLYRRRNKHTAKPTHKQKGQQNNKHIQTNKRVIQPAALTLSPAWLEGGWASPRLGNRSAPPRLVWWLANSPRIGSLRGCSRGPRLWKILIGQINGVSV